MDDFLPNLTTALSAILDRLKSDPHELAARLARRRTPTLSRPPRAWCLAIRASDTRINPATAICSPAHAAYPSSHLSPGLKPAYAPHTLTLSRPLLEKIVPPVYITPPGDDHLRVARDLGRHPESLRPLRRTGPLATRTIPLLFGRRGKPVPLVYSRSPLDPNNANHLSLPDPHFQSALSDLPNYLPESFQQDITRIPNFRPYTLRTKGYDALSAPALSAVEGAQLRFRGWLFLCPACNRKVKILYHPLPVPNIAEYLNLDPAILDADAPPAPPPLFACHKCHRIRFFSRTNVRDAWNHLISHLSAGLLFGHEVPKPSSFTQIRQRPIRPHLNRPPSQRREQILLLLTTTPLTYKQIAAKLDVSYSNVHNHTKKLYHQHNVHSRQTLTLAINPSISLQNLPPRKPSAKHDEVIRRHLAGHSRPQICRDLGLSYNAVNHHLKRHNREARAKLQLCKSFSKASPTNNS
ncbi:MAG TPA: LuxR C-terminal-related transcriptional regulator [Tepidisphaeraceae bacterium]|nr:LuxR C-terminal-related transcriptional regulator [Tepidisphaeraceae bacterium]